MEGVRKKAREKKEGKKHPQSTNHIPWLLLTTIAQFHRIVSPDQHNVAGWGGGEGNMSKGEGSKRQVHFTPYCPPKYSSLIQASVLIWKTVRY